MFLNEIEEKLYSSLHGYLNQNMILSWNDDLIIKARLLIYSESDNGKDFGEQGYIEYDGDEHNIKYLLISLDKVIQ